MISKRYAVVFDLTRESAYIPYCPSSLRLIVFGASVVASLELVTHHPPMSAGCNNLVLAQLV